MTGTCSVRADSKTAFKPARSEMLKWPMATQTDQTDNPGFRCEVWALYLRPAFDKMRAMDMLRYVKEITHGVTVKHTSMKYLPLIFAVLLAACGVPKMVKPGVPQQQYAQDHYQCLQESKSTYNWSLLGIIGHSEPSYDSTLYSSCMEARGYAKE